MKSKLLIYNWKMNPLSPSRARTLFSFISQKALGSRFEVVVAPPFPYIPLLAAKKNSSVKLASQDVSLKENRPLTGDVPANLLKRISVEFAIVGHSERRLLLKENDATVASKIALLQKEKIIPVLCVGEEKKISLNMAWRKVRTQLEKGLVSARSGDIVVAYEPVWSIGGGKETDTSRAEKMCGFIQTFLKKRKFRSRVLYGGSVSCKNASIFLYSKNIDGLLVGSAGLDRKEITCLLSF